MQTVVQPTRPASRLRRSPLDYAALVVLLAMLAGVILAAGWHLAHAQRIYTGISVGGVPVGGLTRAGALQKLTAELGRYPLPPVSLAYEGHEWPLEATQVRAEADLAGAVNRAYLVGRGGTLLANLAEQARSVLAGREITPKLTFDQALLRGAVGRVAAAVAAPGQAARQIGAVAIPAQPAVTVDVEATVAAVADVLGRADLHSLAVVPLAATQALPAAPETGAAPAVAAAAVQQRPLLLRAVEPGLEFALDPAQLAALTSPGQPQQVDEIALRRYLDRIADQIGIPARAARLRFNPETGGLIVLQTSQPGRRLDVDATVAAVRDALASGAATATLAVAAVAPGVDSNRVAEMGIRELVASGTTYFAGSSANRIRNIEVAAEKFEGVVVPPGEVFSFNEAVRDVSAANGFEDSLIIWGDQTANGIGGGVCQVSTTLFRAAYQGGFPIVQRTNHSYVVDWYGEPGLDATIFTPYLDFQFRNDTDAYLLVEPVLDSGNGVLTFNFYGTKPDRTVTVGEPQISDVVQPDSPTYKVDEALAPGEKKQVEWEKDGMTVKVQRTIVENGTQRTDTITSQYEPWRAVYLVGPGTEIPATPTPEPTSAP
jgi:vancomycin resistance protein YoaR